jgi:hypothetical protein
MKFPRRQFLRLAAGAAAFPAVSRIARAEGYPTRPVRIIVPFGTGGTDILAHVKLDADDVAVHQREHWHPAGGVGLDQAAIVDIALGDHAVERRHHPLKKKGNQFRRRTLRSIHSCGLSVE